MFWYVFAVVYGTFVAAFPERTIDYLTRFVLIGYENPEELEASEWYVSLARVEGVLLAVTGVLSIALEIFTSDNELPDEKTSIDVQEAA